MCHVQAFYRSFMVLQKPALLLALIPIDFPKRRFFMLCRVSPSYLLGNLAYSNTQSPSFIDALCILYDQSTSTELEICMAETDSKNSARFRSLDRHTKEAKVASAGHEDDRCPRGSKVRHQPKVTKKKYYEYSFDSEDKTAKRNPEIAQIVYITILQRNRIMKIP